MAPELLVVVCAAGAGFAALRRGAGAWPWVAGWQGAVIAGALLRLAGVDGRVAGALALGGLAVAVAGVVRDRDRAASDGVLAAAAAAGLGAALPLTVGPAAGAVLGSVAVVAAALRGPLLPRDVSPAVFAVAAAVAAPAGPLVALAASAVVVARLVQEHAAAARRLRHAATQRYRALAGAAHDVVAVVTDDGRITEIAASVERAWGRSADSLEGRAFEQLLHPEDAGRFRTLLTEAAGPAAPLEARVRHGDGTWRIVEIAAADLRGQPAVGGIVVSARTFDAGGDPERQLVHHAFHDPLTTLANRALFGDRLSHALARRERADGVVAVLVVDLDDFRTVNDGLGKAAGDELLVAVAQRVTSCLRDGDTAARLGGDEFAVLLDTLPDPGHVQTVADRVLEVLALPLAVGEEAVAIPASIGIAIAGAESTAQSLLGEARSARDLAKANGKSRSEIYLPARSDQALARLELKADLARALAHDELFLLYQPILDLQTGRTVGAEALLRWRHPTRGVLAPATFLPLAEEGGLLVPLGRRVLVEACGAARRWRSRHPEAGPVYVSVNVAGVHLRDPGFAGDVRRALERSSLEAGALVLELSERTIMADVNSVVEAAAALRRLGVRIAVDDFGTGSGSPTYLQHLRVDQLKIDGTFVGELGRGTARPTTVRGMLGLARTLGVTPVAEGVEEEGQRADLLGLRCPYGQGFLFSAPVDAERIGALLSA